MFSCVDLKNLTLQTFMPPSSRPIWWMIIRVCRWYTYQCVWSMASPFCVLCVPFDPDISTVLLTWCPSFQLLRFIYSMFFLVSFWNFLNLCVCIMQHGAESNFVVTCPTIMYNDVVQPGVPVISYFVLFIACASLRRFGNFCFACRRALTIRCLKLMIYRVWTFLCSWYYPGVILFPLLLRQFDPCMLMKPSAILIPPLLLLVLLFVFGPLDSFPSYNLELWILWTLNRT